MGLEMEITGPIEAPLLLRLYDNTEVTVQSFWNPQSEHVEFQISLGHEGVVYHAMTWNGCRKRDIEISKKEQS